MPDRGEAVALLRRATGVPTMDFHPGQWEAIEALAGRRERVLVVQRTGWGKSMVYFIATAFLRRAGAGPTLIISPLLALMRNQLEAARRLGLRPATINSANRDEWSQARARLMANEADLLLISPERLANDEFVAGTLLPIAARVALLVVDEAHCISDWGHDFRPDYRRIGQVIRQLPPNIAVLATTATANRRVVADIETQLGGHVSVQRGPLTRESLRLQAMRMPGIAARLEWLSETIPRLPGSGIVYALTRRDCDRVARWLRGRGIDAAPYYADALGEGAEDGAAHREELERRLLADEVKCLVATTALGMGFDKPTLGFVVHFQAPGSVILYYQQVGRAGRALSEAYGILLSGREDEAINEYFRDSAFPPQPQIEAILAALAQAEDGLTVRQIEAAVNLRQSQIEKVLKVLVVEPRSPVLKQGARWYRTVNPLTLDRARIEHLTRQRQTEWAQMQAYIGSKTCLMQFLANALDDNSAAPCGRCAACLGRPVLDAAVDDVGVAAARRFLRHSELPLEPKKQWDAGALSAYGWNGSKIPEALRAEEGRILSRWADAGFGDLVKAGKEAGRFDAELVGGAAEMIRGRWPAAAAALRWVSCVPSLRAPALVGDFAARLADALGLPFAAAIAKVRATEPQKAMQNRFHQCRNLDGAFAVAAKPDRFAEAVLLVDDVCDSGWTLAVAAALLRDNGSGPVYPFALATTEAR